MEISNYRPSSLRSKLLYPNPEISNLSFLANDQTFTNWNGTIVGPAGVSTEEDDQIFTNTRID